MIDLNNAWCKTTQENYDALIKLGYKSSDNITNAFRKDFETHLRIEDDIIVWGHKKCIGAMGNPDYWSKDREIHLVNGEFKYIAIKPKNNFKEYGFEADFEGEILKQIDNFYYGIVNQHNRFETITWNLVGRPISGSTALNKYELWELKPIKKEWYENPDNFPCIATKDGKNFAVIESIDYLKRVCIYPRIIDFRPATKEEVLSLLVEK